LFIRRRGSETLKHGRTEEPEDFELPKSPELPKLKTAHKLVNFLDESLTHEIRNIPLNPPPRSSAFQGFALPSESKTGAKIFSTLREQF
jgi:hypothetical protein